MVGEDQPQPRDRKQPDLASQQAWIRKYKQDEANGSQFYFIIERLDGTKCGTVRVYDLREDSFCWGSWILNESKTRYSALESAFLVYRFGFEELGFKNSHFDVMKLMGSYFDTNFLLL